MAEENGVRLFVRPIGPEDEDDLRDMLREYGPITDLHILNGYGFVEFENSKDASDAKADFDGKDFKGDRLQIEFARSTRRPVERAPITRTSSRIILSGLPEGTTWQDVKDFARVDGLEVAYADVSRDNDGTGIIEYHNDEDLARALDLLLDEDIRGVKVDLKEDHEPPPPPPPPRRRSRSPYGGRGSRGRGGFRGGYRDREYGGRGRGGYGGRRGGYDDRDRGRGYDDRYGGRDRYGGGRGGGRGRGAPRGGSRGRGGYGRDRDYDRDRDRDHDRDRY